MPHKQYDSSRKATRNKKRPWSVRLSADNLLIKEEEIRFYGKGFRDQGSGLRDLGLGL